MEVSEKRAKTKKKTFREELERMVGLVQAHVMMCIAGDFNGHVGTVATGEEESIGGFRWGTRNLVLVMRNGLALAGTFFKKQENHKISNRSGRHQTELDLLVMKRQQR